MKGSSDVGLVIRAGDNNGITFYTDSDWAGSEERHSTSGTFGLLFDAPVIFTSRKQTNIALSSCEAEYVAACEAAKEIKWLTNFLTELDVKFDKPKMVVDNQSTIKQIVSGDIKRRSKHVDLKYHFVREEFKNNSFDIQYVESENQISDYLTKGLDKTKLEKLVNMSRLGRAKVKPRVDAPAKVALALICFLAAGAWCEEYRVEKGPN